MEDSYNSGSIEILTGLDGIRKRPGLYIGKLGSHGVFQLLKEAFDNCVDEFFAGRNTYVQVWISPDRQSFIVHDESAGIPVGTKIVSEGGRKSKINVFTAIFTKVHAGGKFGSHAYKASAGTHGVGIKTITALSTKLEAWTFRNGSWYHQTFAKGKVTSKLMKGGRPPADLIGGLAKHPRKGTILAWTIDEEVLKKGACLDVPAFFKYVSTISHLNEGLKFQVVDNEGEQHDFHNRKGPVAYVENALTERDAEGVGKPAVIILDDCKLGFQLSSYTESDGLHSYVNSSYTEKGGEHLDGFWSAYAQAIKNYANRTHKYQPRDLRFGIVGFFNVMMSEPSFSSQTKEELNSPIKKDIEEKLYPELDDWFSKNKVTTKALLERATQISKAREQSKELMNAVSGMKSVKGRKGILLPGILQQAPKAKPEDRELFLVEGGSAAGCFSADTRILLADGSSVSFDDLVSKDHTARGVGWNLATNTSEQFDIDFPRITKYTSELVEVTLEDGSVVRCTPDHKWLLESGEYRAAEDLMEGDEIKQV